MFQGNLSSVSSLAALLVEKKDEMRVAVLTAGATNKKECSYSLNSETPDECMWGYCDGHAVTVCYRFAIFYLITEMHRYEKDPNSSILEMRHGGYRVKEHIKLHLFSAKVPCGFMAEENCSLLSWKVPFKGKPHCLKCSSIILIGAYLGIQGPLSHLFSDPVYISSITIPRCGDVNEIKDVEKIKKHFYNLKQLLKSIDISKDSHYRMKDIPEIQITDVDSRDFPKCFDPCKDKNYLGNQLMEQAENEPKEAGAVINTDSNIGSQGIIFTEENKLGRDDFCERMASYLKDTSKEFTNKIVLQTQLDLLKQAQQRLIRALNVDEALKKLKTCLSTEMEKMVPPNYQSSSEVEQCIKCQVTEHTNKQKKFFCEVTERLEKYPNIQTVKRSLGSLKQKFETNSKLLKESLDFLNKHMKELENDVNSVKDILTTHYCDYKETLDALNNLLDKSNASSCDSQFYLDLMSCDWARYLRAMDNDIKMGKCDQIHENGSKLYIQFGVFVSVFKDIRP